MSQLSVSVVICAHADDRWDDTLAAAASVRDQSHPAKELIIVVDYNRPLYERLRAALPDAAVLENRDRQGLSGGRNTGVAASTGEVVAFLDDDAVADADWLKCLVDAYTDPIVAGVGGLTRPAWDTARPAWFPQEFDWVIGCTYLGMPTLRAPVRNLLGGNASFRRDVFEHVGGFISGIGRDRASARSAARRPSSASGSASGSPGRSCCSTSRRSSGIASVRTGAASATSGPAATPRACPRPW